MYIDLGTLTGILLLLALLATIWFWNDSLRARDQVIFTCSRLCNEVGVQFLDETVSLSRLRIQRGTHGNLEFARRYVFEYSGSGTDRWQGYALLSGSNMDSVQLHGPDGTTILNAAGTLTTVPSLSAVRDSSTPEHDRKH
jgi:hypothetical protein